jgi:gliding motility-associated-like protein
MKKINLIIFAIFLSISVVKAQVAPITPEVINSAGGSGSAGPGIEVDWNIGEPVVSTVGNSAITLTQGFLQPTRFGLTALTFVTPVSCVDKTDGIITVKANISGNSSASDSIVYIWSSPSLCPSNTCSMVSNVPAGTYSVTIYHYSGGIKKDSLKSAPLIVSGSSEPCQITIFNGLTPNGDGQNDVFYINNIELFPGNQVSIYNRWGLRMFETTDYNNNTNNWAGTVEKSKDVAPSGTYFYIIDLKNGTKPVKGWLELTHK